MRRKARAAAVLVAAAAVAGCAPVPAPTTPPVSAATPPPVPSVTPSPGPTPARTSAPPPGTSPTRPTPDPTQVAPTPYSWHTDIVATTFWVGEIFDAAAADGSQETSTYDDEWLAHYGGCDGIITAGSCETERRTSVNSYFPTRMTPRQNPFYLDLPFDDVNDPGAVAVRLRVVPWARAVPADVSLMKNRWVELRRGDRTCFGQVEDAGPGVYDDAAYVFGADDRRPANTRYGGAGTDVSPALNGCLDFSELDGQTDHVNWRFVDDTAVPYGPWRRIVTRD